MRAMKQNPWLWVPSLYFAEGIPYFLVNNVSVMMLTRLGVSNGDMALYTSLLYLPWVIKPLWSPFVDIWRTKRWWILTMQILMSACFVGLTITIPHPDASIISVQQTSIGLFKWMLCLFWICAFLSATHDIAADGFYMLALSEGDQSLFVGIRSTFYRLANIFGLGVLIAIAGLLETRLGNIPQAWQITLLITSILFASITLWHLFFLPKAETKTTDTEHNKTVEAIFQEFGLTFVSFFKKKGILIALLFMLLYRLPEAFMLKMVTPFLVGSQESGGLGLKTEYVGLLYGTFGVLFLTIGGILGGIYASRKGLKKSLWIMALLITLPDAVYLYMSLFPTNSLWLIGCCISLEQFGYGFGFTAYMLYLIWFSQGEKKTSHYALCTAFMAAGMMLPGLVAGYLQEAVGYKIFFSLIMLFCFITLLVTALVYQQIPEQYGKK